MIPPSLPIDRVYTGFYCEENVYLLCQRFLKDAKIHEHWQPFVMFISNENKTVALWNQKNGREEGTPVVWDYHVVLVIRPRNMEIGVDTEMDSVPEGESWVYDMDSRLESPCPWNGRFSGTIVIQTKSWAVYFNGTFPEDMNADGSYIAPPPSYAPLQKTSNLMSCFVDVKMQEGEGLDGKYGIVLDRDEVDELFGR
ncbi:hypothetical protein CVT24_010435 [Panaeolus cyanescens]|uniref:Protein N-terminal glutamine amidohydrolase n=1 Tax=Panaeolus cyanescens TaxID=181874 RepID=A0A409YPP5_9AGAR|nr:hypothetical protein CVT24_010435 [Panaeolus cyanescens]